MTILLIHSLATNPGSFWAIILCDIWVQSTVMTVYWDLVLLIKDMLRFKMEKQS